MNTPGYEDLARVLTEAHDQSAKHKGAARHADRPNQNFSDQPLMRITERYGPGFPLGQAEKKQDEAYKMFARTEFAACKQELLGAIVYLAAAVLYVEDAEERYALDKSKAAK